MLEQSMRLIAGRRKSQVGQIKLVKILFGARKILLLH